MVSLLGCTHPRTSLLGRRRRLLRYTTVIALAAASLTSWADEPGTLSFRSSSEVEWTAGPSGSDLIRGRLSALEPASTTLDVGSVICLTEDDQSGAFTDWATPPRSDPFFYLLRVDETAGDGFGSSSAGLPRMPRSGDCVWSGLDCSWISPTPEQWVTEYTAPATGDFPMLPQPSAACTSTYGIAAGETARVVGRSGPWLHIENQNTGTWGWVDEAVFAEALDCSWQSPGPDLSVDGYTVIARSGSYAMHGQPYVGCSVSNYIHANQAANVVARSGIWLHVQNLDTGAWGWVDQTAFGEDLEGAAAYAQTNTSSASVSTQAYTPRAGDVGIFRAVNTDMCLSYEIRGSGSFATFNPIVWECDPGNDPKQIFAWRDDDRLQIETGNPNAQCVTALWYDPGSPVGLGPCEGIARTWPVWSFTSEGKLQSSMGLCLDFDVARNGRPVDVHNCETAVSWRLSQPLTNVGLLYRHCATQRFLSEQNRFLEDFDCLELAQAYIDADGDAEEFLANVAILLFQRGIVAAPYEEIWQMFLLFLEAWADALDWYVRTINGTVCRYAIATQAPYGITVIAVGTFDGGGVTDVDDILCDGVHRGLVTIFDTDASMIDLVCDRPNIYDELLCDLARSRDTR